jgi:hypothetical protein
MFKKILTIPIILFISLFLISTALPAIAGVDCSDVANKDHVDCKATLANPLGAGTTICTLLKSIAGFMIWIAAPIVAGMIIYGAYEILFAKGDPQAINKGKDTILYSVLAYVIILLGWGVTSIIQAVFGSTFLIC